MIEYTIIDDELNRWAAIKGYTVQTRYRDDPIRAFEIWASDHRRKGQIAVSHLDANHVELSIYDGKKQRRRLQAPVAEIFALLNQAEELVIGWLEG